MEQHDCLTTTKPVNQNREFRDYFANATSEVANKACQDFFDFLFHLDYNGVTMNQQTREVGDMGRGDEKFVVSPGFVNTAVTLVLLGVACEQQAMAYTDPGTGALLWQLIAAGFVGAMFYFRKIIALFSRAKSNKNFKE